MEKKPFLIISLFSVFLFLACADKQSSREIPGPTLWRKVLERLAEDRRGLVQVRIQFDSARYTIELTEEESASHWTVIEAGGDSIFMDFVDGSLQFQGKDSTHPDGKSERIFSLKTNPLDLNSVLEAAQPGGSAKIQFDGGPAGAWILPLSNLSLYAPLIPSAVANKKPLEGYEGFVYLDSASLLPLELNYYPVGSFPDSSLFSSASSSDSSSISSAHPPIHWMRVEFGSYLEKEGIAFPNSISIHLGTHPNDVLSTDSIAPGTPKYQAGKQIQDEAIKLMQEKMQASDPEKRKAMKSVMSELLDSVQEGKLIWESRSWTVSDFQVRRQ